ncbi:MAG: cytochrome C oxidase subunit IV family protein [Bdellovibrio sp.]
MEKTTAEKSMMKTLTVVYLGLMILLAVTIITNFTPLKDFGYTISLSISVAKSFLILTFFMKLRENTNSLRMVALAAVLWIIFLFGLTGADYLTRVPLGK